MRNLEFTNEEYYHVYNRGVNGHTIFETPNDFQRFYNSMFLFNNKNYKLRAGKSILYDLHTIDQPKNILNYDEKFVEIIAYILLPNHFHFFLKQKADAGVSKFIHKISRSNSRYYNSKYNRTGPLLDGRFKAKHIDNEAHYEHLLRYIHLNTLDLTDLDWRNGAVKNWGKALDFMKKYPWSSHNYYLGERQTLPIICLTAKQKLFDSKEEYEDYIKQWMSWSFLDSCI